VLTSSSGTTYKWYRGSTVVGSSPVYSATADGDYKVEVTNANGCKATSPVVAVQIINPSIPVITADGTMDFCAGKSVTFSTDAASAYTWYFGTSPVGSSETFTATEAGDYKVETTNVYGCKAISRAVTVEVSPCTPTPVKMRQKDLVIRAFPNPFTEEVQIELKGAFMYQLLDSKGMLVEAGGGNDILRVGNTLKPGLYLVILENSDGTQTVPVVKE
jgi:hypothetical protein